MACSSGDATVSAMVFGFAPGYVARTTIVGGTTSGYSLIGKRHIAISPTMKMTMENTPAKMGRRMKKSEKFITFDLVEDWPDSEVPSSKDQAPEKIQSPSSKKAAPRPDDLGFGPWDFSGAWTLVLGAFSSEPFVFSVRFAFQRLATFCPPPSATASCGMTGIPGRTRWRPST